MITAFGQSIISKLLEGSQSMIESYDPYANAIAERINGVLKQEFLEGSQNCTIEIMKKVVEESILIYNSKRPHISNYMRTPNYILNKK